MPFDGIQNDGKQTTFTLLTSFPFASLSDIGRTLVIMTPIETCVKTNNFKKIPIVNRIVEVF